MSSPEPLSPIITYLRALMAQDREAEARLQAQFRETPGRASGRVVTWSLTRAAETLRRGGRRPFRAGAFNQPKTPHEHAFENIVFALARGDRQAALAAAAWLAKPAVAERLVEQLAAGARGLNEAGQNAACGEAPDFAKRAIRP